MDKAKGDFMEQFVFTIPEAAKCLAISPARLYELIKAGSIEAHKLGKRTLIKRHIIEDYINSLPTLKNDKEA